MKTNLQQPFLNPQIILSVTDSSGLSQFVSRPVLHGSSPPERSPAALYPWSQRRLTFTPSQPNPFPRYGAAINAIASKEGDLYLMGGLVNGSTVKGDLWMIGAGESSLPCYQVATKFEGPGPRVGHASLLVGNAFIIFGGDTKLDDRDKLDDALYLLNTCEFAFHPKVDPSNLCSVSSMVKNIASGASSSRSVRTYIEYFGFEDLCVWRTSGRNFLQRPDRVRLECAAKHDKLMGEADSE